MPRRPIAALLIAGVLAACAVQPGPSGRSEPSRLTALIPPPSRGLPPSPSDQSIRVSRTALPGSWVLLEPWFVDPAALPEIPARLLDIATGQVIELPLGTFGWT